MKSHILKFVSLLAVAVMGGVGMAAEDDGIEPIGSGAAPFVANESTMWSEIPGDVTVKEVVEGCGIKAEPNDYDEVKADVAESLATANRVLAFVTGSTNVWFEVTNYYGSVRAPSLQLYEIRENAKRLVWDQRAWTDEEIDLKLESVNAAVADARDNNPARKWSKYQSVSGEENPLEDTTWLSTPKVALAGGYEWEKVATGTGAAWVLVNNGLVQNYGTTPDETVGNAYFRIQDLEGNAIFEIKKTDSYLVGAVAGDVVVEGSTLVVNYATIADAHPIAKVTTSIEGGGVWYSEDDPHCPATVEWSGRSGAYVCRVTPKVVTKEIYAFAEYEVQGQTLIEHTAPMSAAGGIMCTDGIHKCRPVYQNGSIVWEVFQ